MSSFVVHFKKHKYTPQDLMLMLVSVVIQIILPLNKGKHCTEQEKINQALTKVKPWAKFGSAGNCHFTSVLAMVYR